MLRLIFSFTLLVFSCALSADNFRGHCRDRAPSMEAQGTRCIGPVPEIIETALSRLGHTITWQKVPWKRSIETAKDGNVDILPRHSMTPEREGFLYAVPYGYKKRIIYLMITPDKEFDIKNFSELKGKKVGVIRGSFYSNLFDTDKGFFKKEMPDNEHVVKMLINGRIDIALTSSAHEEEKYRAIPNIKEATFKDVFFNSRNISIPKKSPMSKHFNKFAAQINKMISSGEASEIFKKFGVKPPAQK